MKSSPKDLALREYDTPKTLTAKADEVLRAAASMVAKELGTEDEGVVFMPSLVVACKIKSDPSTQKDPVSFSVVKRPNNESQIHDIVHHILLKDPLFLSSILHGLADGVTDVLSSHFEMTNLVNAMGRELNEETEVETDQNTGENQESENKTGVHESKQNKYEVN